MEQNLVLLLSEYLIYLKRVKKLLTFDVGFSTISYKTLPQITRICTSAIIVNIGLPHPNSILKVSELGV